MSWLEIPNREVWERRGQWFDELGDSIQGEGSYLVSEQACALIGEVRTCFCAGAWIAVIVLVIAVTDAQLRETELPEFKGSTQKLLEDAQANPKLQFLRKRRNSIIHINPDSPAITVDQQWANQEKLEQEARQAVELMFEAFYMSPGT
jgi:hypothetical protein